MAVDIIKKFTGTVPGIMLTTSGVYSDGALYTALKNSNQIQHRNFCFFIAPFTGGNRHGICYLYEDTKLYGWIMVFHYDFSPRVLTVNNGTASVRSWATT